MRLSVLSNINLDSLVGRLSKLNDVYKTEGYGTWVQEIINLIPGCILLDRRRFYYY